MFISTTRGYASNMCVGVLALILQEMWGTPWSRFLRHEMKSMMDIGMIEECRGER